jgi:hypothetical protein
MRVVLKLTPKQMKELAPLFREARLGAAAGARGSIILQPQEWGELYGWFIEAPYATKIVRILAKRERDLKKPKGATR